MADEESLGLGQSRYFFGGRSEARVSLTVHRDAVASIVQQRQG